MTFQQTQTYAQRRSSAGPDDQGSNVLDTDPRSAFVTSLTKVMNKDTQQTRRLPVIPCFGEVTKKRHHN